MKSLILSLLVFLSACSSLKSETDEANTCPGCIEQSHQDLFGLMTVKAPDTAGFEQLPRQSKRVFIECQYLAKVEKTDQQKVQEEELENKIKVDPSTDRPDLSKEGQQICLKLAGKIMTKKGFTLLPAIDKSTERWLFRFEESRREFPDISVRTLFTAPESTRIWGTLTRFKGKEAKPFSHILLSGSSRYERKTLKVTPADHHNLVTKPLEEQNLLGGLIKALVYTGVQNPTAGADQIN